MVRTVRNAGWWSLRILAVVLLCIWEVGLAAAENTRQPAEEALARELLEATGVKGGLIVHLGCGNGRLTATLGQGEGYLVHGLEADANNVALARGHIQSLGLCGRVSVERWDGKRLPYIDNLVNLVVAEDLGATPVHEVMRVLCPNGVAYVRQGDAWKKTVKPRPKEIDEWTHYLHDATGNAVSRDTVVGPPRRLQWTGGPRWARHHEHLASVTALVSSGGRIFYIIDEGSRAFISDPARWALIARDAFNGTVLWKRPVGTWHNHLRGFFTGPAQLPRCLVATGGRVYVPLGIGEPLSVLDAATGETLKTYDEAAGTEEVLYSDGVLLLVVKRPPDSRAASTQQQREPRERVPGPWQRDKWDEEPRHLMALRSDTGKVLWQKQCKIAPVTLATDTEQVYFYDGEQVVCLDRENGDQRWRSEPIAGRVMTHLGPTLVVRNNVVLLANSKGEILAMSADDGSICWTAKEPPSSLICPAMFVIDDRVWTGTINSNRDPGVFTGRDLGTGETRSTFAPDVKMYVFGHHRCHPPKATQRFILASRTGIEFIDVHRRHWTNHHWVRGGCMYGVMPANGLIYTPPHNCTCYVEGKLYGFNALAAERDEGLRTGGEGPGSRQQTAPRLEKGAAYQTLTPHPSPLTPSDDWPTYRHDAARSGFTPAPVPTDLERAWQTDLGAKLSSVVVADGRLFVASVDEHTVHALEADSGRKLWSYTTGGRVDSPPTIYQGLVLFGCADGWVYCLRAADGNLVWRFRGAPRELKLASYGQLESVWPIHGSVLVTGGALYCVAGRSAYLDGGMRLLKLDPRTGHKLAETVLDDKDPETGKDVQLNIQGPGHLWGLTMQAALPDILSADEKYVYMRSMRFDPGTSRPLEADFRLPRREDEDGLHLYSLAGFLDDTWMHRLYWLYGRGAPVGGSAWFIAPRFLPAGKMMVFDEKALYGFGYTPEFYRWASTVEYQLFATAKKVPPVAPDEYPAEWKDVKAHHEYRTEYRWSENLPLLVRAMVLAKGTLFVAGPPHVGKTEAKDLAARKGSHGGRLWAIDAEEGNKLADYHLPSAPTWDGMAAAYGRLYVATTDGNVLCFGNK